ncbi:MAG: reverse transcriptase family protein [Phenylobacterium sp.]|uniref:reverse transcriptase family protein n=1 Tax=Phenylobacterium sp. TaxID=1871053 RepID=UPI003BB595CC
MKTLKRRKTYPLNQSPLYKLRNHRRLAELLKIDPKSLHELSRSGRGSYATWPDTSPSGKVRTIESPYPRLKRVQARLSALLTLIEPPEFLTCPVKGRSYVSNARHHAGARQIVTLDVSAYFPSTTWKRVYWFFNKQLEMSPDVAWTLASLATLDEHLPTGSPLSPIMAYYAHQDVWLSVMRRARDAGCKLTLYMDDLTISGDLVADALVWAIKQDIHASGLRLNNRKQRRYGHEGLVTGIIVTPDGLRPTKASHLKLKRLRDQIAATDDPAAKEKLRRSLRGLEVQHRQVSATPKTNTAI